MSTPQYLALALLPSALSFALGYWARSARAFHPDSGGTLYDPPTTPPPTRREPVRLELRFATFVVDPDAAMVKTLFPGGGECWGTRDEDDPANLREAEAQGYAGWRPVWRSLVEHELLHSLVAEFVFGRPSRVLETESGRAFHPTWERYEEEALALAFQRWVNGGEPPEVLDLYPAVKTLTFAWNGRFAPVLAQMYREQDRPRFEQERELERDARAALDALKV